MKIHKQQNWKMKKTNLSTLFALIVAEDEGAVKWFLIEWGLGFKFFKVHNQQAF